MGLSYKGFALSDTANLLQMTSLHKKWAMGAQTVQLYIPAIQKQPCMLLCCCTPTASLYIHVICQIFMSIADHQPSPEMGQGSL